jgi:hypothetical protein
MPISEDLYLSFSVIYKSVNCCPSYLYSIFLTFYGIFLIVVALWSSSLIMSLAGGLKRLLGNEGA